MLPEAMTEENMVQIASRVQRKPTKRTARRRTHRREPRKKQGIPFAYYSIPHAEDILRTILEYDGKVSGIDTLYERWGGTHLTLASFRIRVGELEKTGRITREKNDIYITELGRMNCSPDPQVQMRARQQAFLCMELNRRLVKMHLGDTPPATAKLNNEITDMGILESVVDRARQVFLRSAKETGFLSDAGILVLPDGIPMSSLEEQDGKSGNDEQGDVAMVAPTPIADVKPQETMDSIIDSVLRQRPPFDEKPSDEEFDAWRRWLDTTFEFARIRARRRQ